MAQVTIYLEDSLAAAVRKRARAAGMSLSSFIAQELRSPRRRAWSPEFLAALGSAPDFPSVEEIRKHDVPDRPREPLE